MNKNLNSIPSGESSEETTVIPQASRSSSEESPSISDISDITPDPKTSPKASRVTPNSQDPNLRDAPNAARLIQALSVKLGKLVEWKKLTLGDGREVYALCFPVSKWSVDPETKELLPS